MDFRLYLITDRNITKATLADAVRNALEGGVRAVQLREKDLPVRRLLTLAEEMRSLTNEFGARLFINDRVDIAVAVDADGVHLGGESMPPDAVRRIVGEGMLIGVSTHNIEEARKAEATGADFITFGPVFDTPSKRKYGPPQGLDMLKEVVQKVKLPVFGLGGIKKENIAEVLATRAFGVATISSILAADDVKTAAMEIQMMLNKGLKQDKEML